MVKFVAVNPFTNCWHIFISLQLKVCLVNFGDALQQYFVEVNPIFLHESLGDTSPKNEDILKRAYENKSYSANSINLVKEWKIKMN